MYNAYYWFVVYKMYVIKTTLVYAYLFLYFKQSCRIQGICLMINFPYTFRHDVNCKPAILDTPFK